MRKARKFRDETPIISTEDGIPEGFVRLSHLVDTSMPRHRTLLKALSDAHKSGTLPAVKLVRKISEIRIGAVYADRATAEAIIRDRLNEWDQPRPSEPEPKPAPPAPPASSSEVIGHAMVVEVMRMIQGLAKRLDALDEAVKRVDDMSCDTIVGLREVRSNIEDIKAAAELRLENV